MHFKIVSVLLLLTLTTNCSGIGFGPTLFTIGNTSVNATALTTPNTIIKVKEKIDETKRQNSEDYIE